VVSVVTLGDPIMVVLEYCKFGSLDGYLKKKNDIGDDIKVRIGGFEVLGQDSTNSPGACRS
jgi:hypothetical protein